MREPLSELGSTPEGLLLACLPLLREVVRAAVRRWRLTAEDAEDLLSEVQLKLLENDGEALRSCHQADRLRAFLATTVARHLLDRRNHEWGKWRPCAEAKRQGKDAELLDQLINRDGLPLDEVVVRLRERGVSWDLEEIERRTALFPARSRRKRESEETLADLPAPTASPEQAVLTSELADRRSRALLLLDEERATWPAEDALILRAWMRGQTVTHIALQLDIPRKKLYRRFPALFDRLRLQLERHGIGHAEMKEIVALDRWENEPSATSAENSGDPFPRPSEAKNRRILPN